MCGISILYDSRVTPEIHRQSLESLRARGPDYMYQNVMTSITGQSIHIGFTRLCIQGTSSSVEQPFLVKRTNSMVLCNGEIFNSDDLIKRLSLIIPPGSSDCAVIPALLERGMSLDEVCRLLDGDFAIVVVSPTEITVARDPYGVRPLYVESSGSSLCIVSELKGFPSPSFINGFITSIKPGTCSSWSLSGSKPRASLEIQWHQPPWLKASIFSDNYVATIAIRHAISDAVAKRLTTIRDIGACLSGGLDSSLVAAIAAKILAKSGKKLHTYTVGMEGSPDLISARIVSKHIGSIHHERILTSEECLATIPLVVRAVETFDITTVRASVGNYLVAKMIAEETPSVKVVLNGDGADEVLGGYLYMRAAPDEVAFEMETDRLLGEIHMYDVARSERSMAAFGLESRSPFLDRQFISVARAIPTFLLKPSVQRMEKYILRDAFDINPLLPPDILWRRKEAFSDGISKVENSWFKMASDEGQRLSIDDNNYDTIVNPPLTPEAKWYRHLFRLNYPESAAHVVAPAMWMPRFITATDPSARTLSLYTE